MPYPDLFCTNELTGEQWKFNNVPAFLMLCCCLRSIMNTLVVSIAQNRATPVFFFKNFTFKTYPKIGDSSFRCAL